MVILKIVLECVGMFFSCYFIIHRICTCIERCAWYRSYRHSSVDQIKEDTVNETFGDTKIKKDKNGHV